MKKANGLLLLLAILVLAIVLFVVATALAEREAEQGQEPPETEIVHIDLDEESVTSFSYSDAEKSFRITHTGNTYTLVDDESFPLDQTIASQMATTVANVTFLRQFEEGTDTSEFGLDKDTTVITATYADGTDLHLTLGDYNRYADAYYCRLENGAVYLINSTFTDYFAYSMKEMLQDETVTAPENGIADVTKIELSFRDGSGFSYVYRPGETDEDGKETVKEAWLKVLADGTTLDDDMTATVKNLYQELFKVQLNDWVDYGVTGDELAAFGLDDPYLTVTVRYTKTVKISGDDATSTVTKKQEVVVGFLVGDLLPEDAPDAETSADTATGTEPADTAAKDDKPSEPTRYFLLEGGEIVYAIPVSELSTLLTTP